MFRVTNWPVVNFDPGSAVQRRLAAARSEIPARQKAVADAWSAVQAARAQGPMVEVRARSALAAARANLAIAEQRAGLSEAH